MFSLVKMIPRVIINKVATFPPYTGDDLERYQSILAGLQPACDTYLDILSNDELDTTPADLDQMRTLLRKMNQAKFFEFLGVMEEVRDFVLKKIKEVPVPENGGVGVEVNVEVDVSVTETDASVPPGDEGNHGGETDDDDA